MKDKTRFPLCTHALHIPPEELQQCEDCGNGEGTSMTVEEYKEWMEQMMKPNTGLFYRISVAWSRFWRKCKECFYDLQCFWERGRHGYCWRDVWDIDQWLIATMLPMLRQFLKEHDCYPERDGRTWEDWNATIQEMITCLEVMENGDVKNICIDWTQEQEDAKNRFFELFSQNFRDLWY